MNESPHKLEAELAALRPRALSSQLVDRIATELNERERMSIADRVLASFVGAGALAACVIIGLLIVQSQSSNSPSVPSPAQVSIQPSNVAEFRQAIAQSSSASFELFR